MVEYHHAVTEHTAVVTFGQQNFTVPLAELSRPQPPIQPRDVGLSEWFKVPKPPPIPTSDQLDERLAARRQVLAEAHEAAKQQQDKVAAALVVVERANRERETAQAALTVHDQHQRQQQLRLEDALATGKPIPTLANGHDDPRHYLSDKVTMAETAARRFQGEFATAQQQLGEALSAVRKAASGVLALLLERETLHGLRELEQRAAILRAELVAAAGFWPDQTGPLQPGRAAAQYLEAAPAWQDNPTVRQGGRDSRIGPWRLLYDRLTDGEHAADFALEPTDA
jgi:hypothetical protein